MNRHLPPGFKRVLRREIRQIAARPALGFMLAPYPILLFLLLSTIFFAGLPTGLPITLLDQDGSTTSRQIARMVDDTPDLEISHHAVTLLEAKAQMLAGKSYGILMIPEHIERDLLAGQSPEVVVFSNNQMLTVGNIVSRATTTALNQFSAGISISLRQSQGQSAQEASASVNPIPMQQSPLFNPTLDYTQFLLASAMPTVLQIFICASAVMAISRDSTSRGGLPRLARLSNSAFTTIAAKLLPYGLAGLCCLWLADVIIFGLFDAPFRGSLALHLLYTILFVISCLSLGTLLALISQDTIGALGLAGLMTAPAFSFAGISFPRMSMNDFSQIWSTIIPLTPYLEARTDQVVRGADMVYTLPILGWQALQIAIYGSLALIVFKRKSKQTTQAGERT